MNELISYQVLAGVTYYPPYQSADVPLAVPLDLGDLLLVLLVLHSQVTSLHLVCLDHVAERLVRLSLGCFQLGYLLQELHPLLVKEAPRVLLGFQSECSAYLDEWQRRRRGKVVDEDLSGRRSDGKKLLTVFCFKFKPYISDKLKYCSEISYYMTATSFRVLACVRRSVVYTVENWVTANQSSWN